MGKSIWTQYLTDQEMEQEGIWIDFGDYEWFCARAGGANLEFRKAFNAETKKVQESMELEDLPDDEGRVILYKCFADHVVKNWKGMVDEHGDPWPYSKANVIHVFEKMPDFFDELRAKLMVRTLFLRTLEAADLEKF